MSAASLEFLLTTASVSVSAQQSLEANSLCSDLKGLEVSV